MIRLNFLRERLTANFRFALVRVRENAENIALYSGEEVEHRGLMDRFDQVIKNYWNIIHRTLLFSGWNLTVSQTSVVLPFLVQANRFFAGSVSFRQLNQTASAFGNLSDALSFFRLMYDDDFTAFRASIIRLDGLRDADERRATCRRSRPPTASTWTRRRADPQARRRDPRRRSVPAPGPR